MAAPQPTSRLPHTPCARDRLVAFPTETVYGLGADATNDRRWPASMPRRAGPSFNPLIAHVPDRARQAFALGQFTRGRAPLAHAFWPGPSSLVVPRAA